VRRAGRDEVEAMLLRGVSLQVIGPFWADQPREVEIDAVALAGRDREAVLVGESKWVRTEDAGRLCRLLAAKAKALPNRAPDLRYAVCARERLPMCPAMRSLSLRPTFSE
jgi:hypothetical protein